MEYYVYQVTVEDEVVYVGKGQGSRYKHATSGKSHNFKLNKLYFEYLLMDKPEPTVNIVARFVEENEALKYEKFLISDLLPECNIRGKVEVSVTGEESGIENVQGVSDADVSDDGDVYVEDIPEAYEDFKVYLKGLYDCYAENSTASYIFRFTWFLRQKRKLKKYQNHLSSLDKLIEETYLAEGQGVGGAPKSFRGVFNLCDAKYKYLQRYFKKRGETLKMYSVDNDQHLSMMKGILEERYGSI